MFKYLEITHKSGEKKLLPIDCYDLGDIITITEFYDNHKEYICERV